MFPNLSATSPPVLFRIGQTWLLGADLGSGAGKAVPCIQHQTRLLGADLGTGAGIRRICTPFPSASARRRCWAPTLAQALSRLSLRPASPFQPADPAAGRRPWHRRRDTLRVHPLPVRVSRKRLLGADPRTGAEYALPASCDLIPASSPGWCAPTFVQALSTQSLRPASSFQPADPAAGRRPWHRPRDTLCVHLPAVRVCLNWLLGADPGTGAEYAFRGSCVLLPASRPRCWSPTLAPAQGYGAFAPPSFRVSKTRQQGVDAGICAEYAVTASCVLLPASSPSCRAPTLAPAQGYTASAPPSLPLGQTRHPPPYPASAGPGCCMQALAAARGTPFCIGVTQLQGADLGTGAPIAVPICAFFAYAPCAFFHHFAGPCCRMPTLAPAWGVLRPSSPMWQPILLRPASIVPYAYTFLAGADPDTLQNPWSIRPLGPPLWVGPYPSDNFSRSVACRPHQMTTSTLLHALYPGQRIPPPRPPPSRLPSRLLSCLLSCMPSCLLSCLPSRPPSRPLLAPNIDPSHGSRRRPRGPTIEGRSSVPRLSCREGRASRVSLSRRGTFRPSRGP